MQIREWNAGTNGCKGQRKWAPGLKTIQSSIWQSMVLMCCGVVEKHREQKLGVDVENSETIKKVLRIVRHHRKDIERENKDIGCPREV